MNFNISYSENFYFFTSKLTEENKKSIIKFKNISIIYESNKASNHYEELIKIIKFCKEKKIKDQNFMHHRLQLLHQPFLHKRL